MSNFKTMALTVLVGAGLGEILLRIMTAIGLPVPLQEGKKPVFIIGIILFSLAFRLLIALRENPEESPDS